MLGTLTLASPCGESKCMLKLDTTNVPQSLRSLMPIAEEWGIGDDFDREQALNRASPEDLEMLVHCIDGISDDEFYGWLAGPESFSSNPTKEYIAFSCLSLAIESAKLKLQSHQQS